MNSTVQLEVSNPVKKENMLKIILRVASYMKPYWVLAVAGIILLLSDVYFNIKTALIIQDLTNTIAAKNINKLYAQLGFYVPFSLVFIFLMCLGIYIRRYVETLVNRDLCSSLFKKINLLPFSVIQSNHSGDFASRVNRDVDLSVGLIGSNVYSLIENTLICIGAFIILVRIDLLLSLLALATGPITFFVGRIFDSRIRATSKNVQDKGGEVRSLLQEFLQGMPVVRAFNMEKDFHDRYIDSRNSQIKIMKKITFYNVFMWRIVISTNVTVNLLIFYFVASSAISGRFSVGTALAFMFLMGRVQWPFINISKNWGTVQQSYGAAKRVFEIMDMDSEQGISDEVAEKYNNSPKSNNEESAISFENVSFAYKTSDEGEKKELYKNLSIKISSGEIVALVGPSGSGKTTLARMCCGIYLPDKGNVNIFGYSLSSKLSEARNLISYVPQNPYLFAGTIRENISYGRENAADDEIVNAAKAANAHEFIATLENGYDTLLGEKGVSLSGGQRQRIAIARAFLRKSPIIILDEATSALDNESEFLVHQSMDRLTEGRTALIIAHRLSTIRNASRILVMEDGKIAEEGTHEALMEQNGLYKNLYSLQFKDS